MELAPLYLAKLSGGCELDAQSLEAQLRQILETAQAAWPEVRLSPALFLARLAVHAPTAAALAAVQGADLFLACACAEGEPTALELFDRQFLTRLQPALARFSPTRAFVDDVRQHLRTHLLVGPDGRGRIADYAGRGPLRSWVRAAAVRHALTLLRATHHDRGTDEVEQLAGGSDPELELIRRQYRQPFQEAFATALQTLSARQQTLIRMYFIDALNLAEIGHVQKVHEATISRWLQEARKQLLAETRRNLAERLNLGAAEIDSLMNVVSSRLEASLKTLLSS